MIAKMTKLIEKLRSVQRFGFLETEERHLLNRIGAKNCQLYTAATDSYSELTSFERDDLVRINPDWQPTFTKKTIEITDIRPMGVRGFRCPRCGSNVPVHAAYAIDGFAGFLFNGDDRLYTVPYKNNKSGYKQCDYVVIYMDLEVGK